MKEYILVVDDEEDLCDIYEMALRSAFSYDIAVSHSGNQALRVMAERGNPVLILSDFRMPDGDGAYFYNALKQQKSTVPFVLCTADLMLDVGKKFSDIQGYLEKPADLDKLLMIVGDLLKANKNTATYVPVRISLLKKWGTLNFDLFLKLSEKNYVKVFNVDDAFTPADAERFSAKNILDLHMSLADSEKLLRDFEQNIQFMMNSHGSSAELAIMTLETLDSVGKLAASLGWTPEVVEAAKQSVNLAVKAIAADPNILDLLKRKLSDTNSRYSLHVGQLTLLTCGLCQQLGWTSESTQMKLGMASLMHDITIDEKMYDEVLIWNQTAADVRAKTPEAIKYRNHPVDAANLLQSIKNLPPDVDQIILQHHETKDGTGFPRGLTGGRISPMATVFIVVEDLINHLDGAEDFDTKLREFMRIGLNRYNSGNFKKVFEVLMENSKKMKAQKV